MQRLLVMFVMTQLNGCASSKRQPPAVEATAARVPQAGGNACTVEPVGRGCRVMPFEGPCVAYFTANDAELKDLQQSRYLNLRFEGDRRPFLDKPLLAPAAAHRSLVDAGGSLSSLIVLIELLGGPTSLSMDFPSGDIVQSVAYSPDYSASADRLKPGMLELLAGITDLPRVSAQWDAAIRAASPEVEYHPNASAECLALLSTIVDMARDARSSHRRATA